MGRAGIASARAIAQRNECPECRAQYDLAAQRPVFASKNADRETVRCIVDTRMDTSWNVTEPSWAMIDLEGNKAFHQVMVRLGAGKLAVCQD